MNEAYLVVDWAEVNIRFKWFSGNTTGKHVLSGVAEPVFDKDTGHIFDLECASFIRYCTVVNPERWANLGSSKGGAVLEFARKYTRLGKI